MAPVLVGLDPDDALLEHKPGSLERLGDVRVVQGVGRVGPDVEEEQAIVLQDVLDPSGQGRHLIEIGVHRGLVGDAGAIVLAEVITR